MSSAIGDGNGNAVLFSQTLLTFFSMALEERQPAALHTANCLFPLMTFNTFGNTGEQLTTPWATDIRIFFMKSKVISFPGHSSSLVLKMNKDMIESLMILTPMHVIRI